MQFELPYEELKEAMLTPADERTGSMNNILNFHAAYHNCLSYETIDLDKEGEEG